MSGLTGAEIKTQAGELSSPVLKGTLATQAIPPGTQRFATIQEVCDGCMGKNPPITHIAIETTDGHVRMGYFLQKGPDAKIVMLFSDGTQARFRYEPSKSPDGVGTEVGDRPEGMGQFVAARTMTDRENRIFEMNFTGPKSVNWGGLTV
jgi:hypothetical protein